MELFTIVGLLILGPILVRFLDKTYKALKGTQFYKDLQIED